MGASNQNTWLMLLKAINRQDLQENEMFSSNLSRKKNISQLVDILNTELLKKTSDEWLKIFDNNGLPCGPINSITEMFEDPQTIHREMIIEVDNKKAGKSKAIGMPIKFSKSKTEKSKGAPFDFSVLLFENLIGIPIALLLPAFLLSTSIIISL